MISCFNSFPNSLCRSLLLLLFPHLTRFMNSLTNSIRIAIIVILFFFLAFPPPISVGSSMFSRGSGDMKQKKMVLGSRPPQCVNRCFHCKPCMAALVTLHHKSVVRGPSSSKEDESYYLLSWKCKCGDKYFQP